MQKSITDYWGPTSGLKASKMLIIISGLPGSGKSSLARRLAPPHAVCTTDDYEGLYTYSDDEYVRPVFHGGVKDEKGIPMIVHAHDWNQAEARLLMEARVGTVVIPNTNTQRWEFEPYLLMAGEYNYSAMVISLFDGGFTDAELADQNGHGVPEDVIAGMRARYEHDWIKSDPRKPWERG